MKRLILVLLLCLTIVLFASCSERSEFFDLAICGSYAVPGMYCDNLKGNSVSCTVIERDSYGRILFEYKTKSRITMQEEKAYVICQKYDSDYVYFYEDEGYSFANDYDNDIMNLKENNDWNKQFNEAKMSRRSNKTTFDLQIAEGTNLELSEIMELCARKLQVDSSEIELCGFVDRDSSGKELLLISKSNNQSQMYFALFNIDNTVAILEISNHTVSKSQLAKFKCENNWIYGF